MELVASLFHMIMYVLFVIEAQAIAWFPEHEGFIQLVAYVCCHCLGFMAAVTSYFLGITIVLSPHKSGTRRPSPTASPRRRAPATSAPTAETTTPAAPAAQPSPSSSSSQPSSASPPAAAGPSTSTRRRAATARPPNRLYAAAITPVLVKAREEQQAAGAAAPAPAAQAPAPAPVPAPSSRPRRAAPAARGPSAPPATATATCMKVGGRWVSAQQGAAPGPLAAAAAGAERRQSVGDASFPGDQQQQYDFFHVDWDAALKA